jgi:hypothetical protein
VTERIGQRCERPNPIDVDRRCGSGLLLGQICDLEAHCRQVAQRSQADLCAPQVAVIRICLGDQRDIL